MQRAAQSPSCGASDNHHPPSQCNWRALRNPKSVGLILHPSQTQSPSAALRGVQGVPVATFPTNSTHNPVFLLQKLYTWTQTILSTWPSQETADLSTSEDLLPYSTDSGVGCENDSEAVTTSLSEPLTPDTCSQGVSACQDLDLDEQTCSLADAPSQELLGSIPRPLDILKEYTLWLEMCIAALEKEVSEEEILQVDQAVDALARWEMFTGELPDTKRDLHVASYSTGLRKVLGDTFSSLRRKLSARKLARSESSPRRWRWEDS